jgi:hypothetical protein
MPTSESLHLPDQVPFESTVGALRFIQPAQPSYIAGLRGMRSEYFRDVLQSPQSD